MRGGRHERPSSRGQLLGARGLRGGYNAGAGEEEEPP